MRYSVSSSSRPSASAASLYVLHTCRDGADDVEGAVLFVGTVRKSSKLVAPLAWVRIKRK